MDTTKLAKRMNELKEAQAARDEAYRSDDDDNFIYPKARRNEAKAAVEVAANAYNAEFQALLDANPSPEAAKQISKFYVSTL